MKKIKIYLMLFLLGTGIVVFNYCSKENEFIEQESIQLNDGITITDGMLTFATVELYNETIQLLSSFDKETLNNWEKAYNYVSLRSGSEEIALIREIGNTFATLLNPEKKIIIAGNYFQLDFENETITKRKWDELCGLDKTSESNTYYFKDDVNIFDENPSLKSISSDPCGYEGRLWVERNTLANGHADYRLEYDSWTIFRHVRAEIEPDGSTVKVWLSIPAGQDYNAWNELDENWCGYLNTNISLGGTTGSSSNISYDIYNGTSRLEAYRFKVTFSAQSQTTPYDDKDTWDIYLDCATVNCP